MKDNGYVVLDTRAFDQALAKKDALISSYNELNQEYDRIVNALLRNWKGRGANAFKKDAVTVKANIVGIFDVLKTMCDTLTDCKTIFAECDSALGEYNRNPEEHQE